VNDYIEQLVEARNRAWHEAKSLMSAATAEKRELSGEEQETLDRIWADIDAKDVQIKDLRSRAQSEAEAAVAREAYADLVRPTEPAVEVDPVEAFLRGQSGARYIDVDIRKAAAEKRAIRAGASGRELRDLVVGTAGAGGNLRPTSFERSLYDFLENVSGVRQVATVITTTSGESLELPVVATHGTAAAVAEGTALAEGDASFSKITMQAFKFGQLLQISSELLQDSGVDIVGFAAADLGRALGRVTGAAYATGAGGAGGPQGIMTAAGTGKTGGTGVAGVPTIAELTDLAYSLGDPGYRANAAWLMRDATAGKIRNLTNTSGDFLWQPAVQAGQPDRLLGYPVVIDPFVAATGTASNSVLFGDIAAAFVIRDAGSIRLESSQDYAFNQDLTTWRAVLRTDSDMRDANAVKLFRGGTA
jgi:HK97 family phage major capsid protein